MPTILPNISIKKKGTTLLDLLTLWIICSVWPGIIPGGIIFIASHKILFSLGVSVVIGLIATIYMWSHVEDTYDVGTDTT